MAAVGAVHNVQELRRLHTWRTTVGYYTLVMQTNAKQVSECDEIQDKHF